MKVKKYYVEDGLCLFTCHIVEIEVEENVKEYRDNELMSFAEAKAGALAWMRADLDDIEKGMHLQTGIAELGDIEEDKRLFLIEIAELDDLDKSKRFLLTEIAALEVAESYDAFEAQFVST